MQRRAEQPPNNPARRPARRKRTADPLASAEAVRTVLAEFRRLQPELAPARDKDLGALLRAADYAERHPAGEVKPGRKATWKRMVLIEAASSLRTILARGTWGHKAVRTFVTHYLPILDFPEDVRAPLERGEINLFEAEQLARLSPGRLGVSSAAVRTRRSQLLRAHLAAQEAGTKLMARVNALFAGPEPAFPAPAPEIQAATAELEAQLAAGAEADEGEPDPGHLFYDHLRMIAQALRETTPADLTDEVMERLFAHGDEMLLILQQLQRRKRQPAKRLLI